MCFLVMDVSMFFSVSFQFSSKKSNLDGAPSAPQKTVRKFRTALQPEAAESIFEWGAKNFSEGP